MTRDDIIRMAREAELLLDIDTTFPYAEGTDIGPMLEKFAALVAAAEREACAKICESLITDGDIYPGNFVLEACAKSIRSKSE